MNEQGPKMIPEIISGPQSLEQFLDLDERLRQEFILAAEDEMETIKDLEGVESRDPAAAFLLGYTQKMMAENEVELHEISLARMGLNIGNKQIALNLLRRRIEQCKFIVQTQIRNGQHDRATEADKQRFLLTMLLEDQVE